jgi:putative addiction module CopG family antidote
MRNIINISLPEEMSKWVEKKVKGGKFSSTSEYFRHLLRTQELVEELEKSRREFKAGKGRILRSLKDLR